MNFQFAALVRRSEMRQADQLQTGAALWTPWCPLRHKAAYRAKKIA